jgi:hypothetical protein
MNLCERLAAGFADLAAEVAVERLSIGLGYTAVSTTDGGVGLAFTYTGAGPSCTKLDLDREIEGEPASFPLRLLASSVPLHRSIGLATLNALNHSFAVGLPEDRKNETLFEILGIQANTRLAMVGYIGPLVTRLQQEGVVVEVVDADRSIGDESRFMASLRDWAEVLLMTSTSILNGTTEPILAQAAPNVRCALLGPSTPLTAEPFAGLPVHVLAGTVPVDKEATFRAVRHGRGTPRLQQHARKPYLRLRAAA